MHSRNLFELNKAGEEFAWRTRSLSISSAAKLRKWKRQINIHKTWNVSPFGDLQNLVNLRCPKDWDRERKRGDRPGYLYTSDSRYRNYISHGCQVFIGSPDHSNQEAPLPTHLCPPLLFLISVSSGAGLMMCHFLPWLVLCVRLLLKSYICAIQLNLWVLETLSRLSWSFMTLWKVSNFEQTVLFCTIFKGESKVMLFVQ